MIRVAARGLSLRKSKRNNGGIKCSSLFSFLVCTFFFALTLLVLKIQGDWESAKSVVIGPSRLRSLKRRGLISSFRFNGTHEIGLRNMNNNYAISRRQNSSSHLDERFSYSSRKFDGVSKLWVVVAESGVPVTSLYSTDSTPIKHLSKGTILVGDFISKIFSFQASGEEVVRERLRVVYPLRGYITSALTTMGTISNNYQMNKDIFIINVRIERDTRCDTSTFMTYTDMRGGDLIDIPSPAISPLECCLQCTLQENCRSWTYAGSNQCWLKDSTSTKVTLPRNSDMGLRPRLPDQTVLVSGIVTATSESQRRRTKGSRRSSNLNPDQVLVPNLRRKGLNARNQGQVQPCCVADIPTNISGISSIGILSLQQGTIADHCDSDERTLGKKQRLDYSPHLKERVGRSAGHNDPSKLFTGKFDFNYNPHVLKQKPSGLSWVQQWPIGTGKFGALVGGTFNHEVVPLSVTDLYVHNPCPDCSPAGDHPAANNPETRRRESKSEMPFYKARSLLQNARVREAQVLLNTLQRDTLGMFQYVADLLLVTSTSPIRLRGISQDYKDNIPPMPPFEGGGLGPGPEDSARLFALREGLLRYLQPVAMISSSHTMHLSQSSLDTMQGVVLGEFVYSSSESPVDMSERPPSGAEQGQGKAGGTEAEAETVYVQQREWFASDVDQVIAARVSCVTVSGGSEADERDAEEGSGRAGSGEACVHSAVSVARQNYRNVGANAKVERVLEHWTGGGAEEDRGGDNLGGNWAGVRLVLSSANGGGRLPHTEMCIAVRCAGGDLVTTDSGSGRPDKAAPSDARDDVNPPVIVCNTANEMEVYVTVATVNADQWSGGDVTFGESHCRPLLSKALQYTFEDLRDRHVRDFSAKMGGVSLSFGPSANASVVCPSQSVRERLRTFGSPCISDVDEEAELSNGQDARLLTEAFQMGRNLFLSGSTKSVLNLQGIWADGPTSAWNGDYHLNINLQMAYCKFCR